MQRTRFIADEMRKFYIEISSGIATSLRSTWFSQ